MHTPAGMNKDLLDAPHEECGVVGAYLPGSHGSAAARLVFLHFLLCNIEAKKVLE